jgi:hypothetical protein
MLHPSDVWEIYGLQPTDLCPPGLNARYAPLSPPVNERTAVCENDRPQGSVPGHGGVGGSMPGHAPSTNEHPLTLVSTSGAVEFNRTTTASGVEEAVALRLDQLFDRLQVQAPVSGAAKKRPEGTHRMNGLDNPKVSVRCRTLPMFGGKI